MQINKATFPLVCALRQIGKRVRLRGWERFLRLVFNPDRQQHVGFKIPFYGFTYQGYADNFIDWNVLFYGSYESFELRLLSALALQIDEPVFVDVGANVGHHALYMSTSVNQLHAFEPNPCLWSLITEKLSANKVKNTTLHRFGLGVITESKPLYLGPECGEASLISSVNRNYFVSNAPVDIISGDESFHKLGIHKLDLVKIDIEGFEKYAIEGMILSLTKSRPIMLVELTEIGREQFGSFSEFIKIFPKNYKFYFCHWVSSLIIRKVIRPADELGYAIFVGNVFCVPNERETLFTKVIDRS